MSLAIDGMKECSACHVIKPGSEFHLDNATKDKLTSQCKQCRSKKSLSYYYANQEERQAYQRAYQKVPKTREVRRAMNSRRRTRALVSISKEDRELSVAYRKAIKNDNCYYCGGMHLLMHDDHKLSLARGGTDHWWNLVRACPTCNTKKGTKCAEHFIAGEKCDCPLI